jgi:hypothetical protein
MFRGDGPAHDVGRVVIGRVVAAGDEAHPLVVEAVAIHERRAQHLPRELVGWRRAIDAEHGDLAAGVRQAHGVHQATPVLRRFDDDIRPRRAEEGLHPLERSCLARIDNRADARLLRHTSTLGVNLERHDARPGQLGNLRRQHPDKALADHEHVVADGVVRRAKRV